MAKTFTFIEETQITKEGEKTFWYTKMQEDQGFPSIVTDSLSYKKDEAKVMYDLIVKHNGEMKTVEILETTTI